MTVSSTDLRILLEGAGVKPELARSLNASSPLLRQGVDSVDFPAFCVLLEDRYGVTLDDETALGLRSLEDFARYIRESQ